jgi:transposase
MPPLRGWRRRGERLHAKVPHGHWKTLTFVAALRCGGIDAPCVFDGPINGESFKAYFEQVLAPALRPGDIVVMDNLGSHKGSAIRRAIRAAGARLVFLPPYSPDLIRSSRSSQNSRHFSERPKSAPSMASGSASAVSSTPSLRRMRQLSPKRRICFYLNLKCSRPASRDHHQ